MPAFGEFDFRAFERGVHQIVDDIMISLDKARKAGTLDKADRSPQYEPPFDVVTPERAIDHLNKMGVVLRGLQKDKERFQRDLVRLKFWYALIVAIVTSSLTVLGEYLLRWLR